MEMLNAVVETETGNLGKHFEENELAYIALTGKVELCLRGRLVWRLQTRLFPLGLLVAREWTRKKRRIDAAILEDDKLVALLEFKAMVTFDCTEVHSEPQQYPRLMLEDIVKMKQTASVNTFLYSILFATHPLRPIPDAYKRIVKYAGRMNKALRMYNNSQKVLETCDRTINNYFQAKHLRVSRGRTLNAGEWFDVPVEILCWFVGPIRRSDL